jgi:hypothetical protein
MLIEIAPDPVGWAVRTQERTRLSFGLCEAAVRYARDLADSLKAEGAEPRICVYLTPRAQRT